MSEKVAAASETAGGRMGRRFHRSQVVGDRLGGAHRSAGAQQLHTERRRRVESIERAEAASCWARTQEIPMTDGREGGAPAVDSVVVADAARA